MKAKIEIIRSDKIRITMPDGRDIDIRVVEEPNPHHNHILITGDDRILLSPAASNQVRVLLPNEKS
jgi:hypothetical protein